jgi:hypothetical protein
VTGDKQQDRVADDRARRHPTIGPVVVHQLRNHSRARGFRGFLDQPDDVLIELGLSSFTFDPTGPALLGFDIGAEIEQPGQRVGDPGVKLGFVVDRHAQNPADHVDRQRVGELIDNVDAGFVRAFFRGLVEQLVDDLLTQRLLTRDQLQ